VNVELAIATAEPSTPGSTPPYTYLPVNSVNSVRAVKAVNGWQTVTVPLVIRPVAVTDFPQWAPLWEGYNTFYKRVLPPEITEAMQGGRGGPKLADILSNITRVWAANPWIAGFVLREVLVPGGPMRTMFLREFPERLAPIVERAVRAEIERGALRSDLDPKLLVLSVVSLAVFPFLGFPLTSRVFGVRNDEEFVTRFLHHTQALLACGVAAGGSPA